MPRRKTASIVCISIAAAIARTAAQTPDALAPLDRMVALAEESLRSNERQIAESRYRTALLQGWMILGALHHGSGQLAQARQAFEEASTSAVENGAALQSLAIVQLQMGDTAPALEILTRLASESPRNVEIRRMLAEALIAAGKPGEAVQELDEARAIAADDPEALFALASAYLRLKKPETAETLFAQVAAARRLPETHVLIGRTYRDFEYYDLARAALKRALAMDPGIRRAHYYLGTTALMEEGVVRLDEAIAEFRHELKVSPNDRATTVRLGMALVEARRAAEALPLLEAAARVQPPPGEALLYLGRAQLALKRSAEAVTTLKRALAAATPQGTTPTAIEQARLRSIHYQLGTALRETGATREAEAEFQTAQRLSAERAATEREQLRLYMRDDAASSAESASRGNPASAQSATSAARESTRSATSAAPIDATGVDAIPPAERAALEARVRTTLTRTYLNLGIMLAQANRFSRAAEILEKAAAIDPAFPQVQYSLGVATFNAERYDKAVQALTRALDQSPNPEARRMLALAHLNLEQYAKAAEILRTDPKLPSDPSLQYAYGIALVRSDRAQEAEQIFSRVLSQHPDVPELNVVLGQAHAAQGDYDEAVTALRRAIAIKPDVAEAHASLGLIYMQQGQLAAAADALNAELKSHPGNTRARNTLATVLDLEGRSDDALRELRTVLAAKPGYADARYLLGKILLARGSAAEAAEHLELAARLAPEDANIHYQLGQAYQRLGRTEQAAKEFEAYQRLKDKRRGGQR